jgi:hypothetical protein
VTNLFSLRFFCEKIVLERAHYLANNGLLNSSQVKLLITNNSFCIVQRATAQSKIGISRDYGVAEAAPGFQAGWSDCIFFLSLSVSFVCSSGVDAAQTFVTLRRSNHEHFERSNLYTFFYA